MAEPVGVEQDWHSGCRIATGVEKGDCDPCSTSFG